MKKSKKIIIIVICTVILIAIITIGTILLVNNNEKQEQELANTNLDEIYTQVEATDNYTLSLKVDDKNQTITKISGEKSRIETYNEGKETITIVNGGNTYILMPDQKKCYLYKNNTSSLQELQEKLEILKELTPTTGEENINGKTYKYAEYDGVSVFLINYNRTLDEATLKTRVYYDGNELVYAKTFDKNFEQLVEAKIEYSSSVSDSDFEIPQDYEVIE